MYADDLQLYFPLDGHTSFANFHKCLTEAGAELWAGLDGPGPAHIDSWPAQSEIKK